ncbi:glycerophosphoinositol inositolphosphodiesterase GDPD2 isoform 1-T2 [Acanthopagrus schlegelii]
MSQDESCSRVGSRCCYSCHWERRHESKRKCACCGFWFVVLVLLLSAIWLYICMVTFNDQDEVNWQGFTALKWWVNWFMVVIIVSAVITTYCVLLLLFALFQVALGEPLDLHWLHKIFLFLGVILITAGVTGISLRWEKEWPTVPLSLQATGPFLQFGAVVAMTLLSPFIFSGFNMDKSKCSQFLMAVVFVVVSVAIFLCPLFIQSPCLIEKRQLPEKPKLIGHRGAPMLAPENTMMSFKKSIECNVTAFETDVQLSKDRVPFLLHDNNSDILLRTTNVKSRNFQNKNFSLSTNWTWEELQSLNAGEWFLETDPFRSVYKLSEEERELSRNQSIPSLHQLLDLAKEHDVSVLFDLYNPDTENDTEVIVDTIMRSGIDPRLVLWLPYVRREYVKETAPGFIQVYSDREKLEENNGTFLNVKYSKLKMEEIRDLRSSNITVNMWVVNERWLFSLLWCAGASSVTTNACHLLKDMEQPDWVMAPRKYLIIWIAVDITSIVIMIGVYIIQRKTDCFCSMTGTEMQRDQIQAWNEKELYPFLATG